MTLTNHLLTGAALAKFLPLPIAIPLALASHFVLDAVPHFGFSKDTEWSFRQVKIWRSVLVADICTAVAISIWLISSHHVSWFLVGLVAYAPDIFWIYRFTIEEKFGKLPPTKGNRFIQFHRGIQKYERLWGGFVELGYAIGAIALIRL